MQGGAVGLLAGLRGLTGIAGDLLDGLFQLAEGIADLRRVSHLAFGALMQAVTQVRQAVAAAGDLLGMQANAADQPDQIVTQLVEGVLDGAHLGGLCLQADALAEMPGGPARQLRHQAFQYAGQAALQGVDADGDEQQQDDHAALQ